MDSKYRTPFSSLMTSKWYQKKLCGKGSTYFSCSRENLMCNKTKFHRKSPVHKSYDDSVKPRGINEDVSTNRQFILSEVCMARSEPSWSSLDMLPWLVGARRTQWLCQPRRLWLMNAQLLAFRKIHWSDFSVHQILGMPSWPFYCPYTLQPPCRGSGDEQNQNQFF